MTVPCPCGDDDPAGCLYLNAGYEWCVGCEEHHRPPVGQPCPIDAEVEP